MKVKVVKCDNKDWWYADKIGEVFDVEFYDPYSYRTKSGYGIILKVDLESVEESTESEDLSEERIVVKGNVVKIKSTQGYCGSTEHTLLKLTDTCNGYIAKFPSYSSVHQDNYICLEYSEAGYLFKALKAVYEPK